MKSVYFGAFVLVFVQCKTSEKPQLEQVKEPVSVKQQNQRVSRALIIFYDEKTGNEELLKEAEKYGAEVTHRYNALKGIAIKIPEEKSLEQAIIHFRKVKGVTSVHRDEIHHLHKNGVSTNL